MKGRSQRGNAMIYVLVAIVLFAALSLTLGRQSGDSQTEDLDEGKAQMYAAQIIGYATAAKSAVDQMLFSGTKINDLDFTLPSQGGFNAGDTTKKVYHPDGGGLNPGKLPEGTTTSGVADPVAGWYMGRFNNVQWTKTSAQDVMLVAFQIKKPICEQINKKITGTTDIPKMTDTIRETMIDDSFYAGATNEDLTTDPASSPICGDCDKRASLCVEDSAGGTYAFYTVLEDQ